MLVKENKTKNLHNEKKNSNTTNLHFQRGSSSQNLKKKSRRPKKEKMKVSKE